jgi:hypothetical protein
VLGIAVAVYVLYRNVWPVPDPPFDVFPYLVAAWLALGGVWALAARVPEGVTGAPRAGRHDHGHPQRRDDAGLHTVDR